VQILIGTWLIGYHGWLAACMLRRPTLRLDPQEIRYVPVGSRAPQAVRVTDVTGYRWPYPADLWIEAENRPALCIRMVGVRSTDRNRVREWLSQRWVDGGLAPSSGGKP
jgi:hypothetical protein